MGEFIVDIRTELPLEQANEVYAMLAKVMRNILRNPCEAKFRTLRKDNKLVANHICTSMAAVSLLLLVGFEDQEEAYHCPMETDLEQMRAADEELQQLTMNLDLLDSSVQPDEEQPLVRATFPNPLRRTARVSEEERSRAQQEEQLQALRASQHRRHCEAAAAALARPEAAAPAAEAAPAAAEAATLAAPEELPEDGDATAEGAPLLFAELLSDDVPYTLHTREGTTPARANSPAPSEPLLGATGAEADGKMDERKLPIRTVFDFQRREAARQPGEAPQVALEELKRLQRERYRQFQSDPHAREAEAYARPPTGLFDGSSRASTAPSTPGEWLSQESKRISQGLKGTSERLTVGLSDASSRLSAGLSDVAEQLTARAWAPWQTPRAGAEPEEPEVNGKVGALPGRFRVVGRSGALVRSGAAKDTSVVDVLHAGTEFVGLEWACSSSGEVRLRLEAPLCGWLTLKAGIVERVPEEDSAEFG